MNSPCGSCGALPSGLDAKPPPHNRRIVAGHRANLRVRPDVERAFGLVRRRIAGLFGRHAVGVFGRVEPALAVGEIAHDVGQRVFRDRRVEVVARRLRGLEIRERELRLVVQHLLEVRDAPFGVDRVAVKAATDVVAHATHAPSPAACR